MDRLTEIRQRTEAATPGPWKVVDQGNTVPSLQVVNETTWENPKQIKVCSSISPKREADANFIAHSREDMEWLLTLADALKAQLASTLTRAEAAEAERDACKADLKLMADWYRDSVCDDGICGWCKQDADHGLDGYANECAGFYKNDCFEWRGQGAGKGDAPNE